MKICFKCYSNHDQVMVKSAKFRLRNGMTITMDRDQTETETEDMISLEGEKIISMTWKNVYIWMIEDVLVEDMFLNSMYPADTEYAVNAMKKFFEGAEVKFEYDNEAGEDYWIETVSFEFLA